MARAGTKKAQRCYLYALAKAPAVFGRDTLSGIDGAPVYAITEGDVAVVVSDIDQSRIRPERRHIAAHNQVQRGLLGLGAILPMAFGIIADSPAAVTRMLKTHHRSFAEQLRQLEGRVEMGLRVTLDVANVFEYYVRHLPELQVLRDQMLQEGSSREDKIEVGRRFGQMMDQARDEALERIEGVLAPACFDIRRNAVKGEKEIANIACLVGRDRLADFEAKIDEAAKGFDDDYVFQYSGPWPPHNFVNIDVAL